MKIYYIANARMPNEKAHGIQLAKMCEAFVEEGADIELIVPKRKNLNPQSLRNFYGLRKEIPITYLPIVEFGATPLGFYLSALTFGVSYFFYMLVNKIRGHGGFVYTIDLDNFSFVFIPLLGMPYAMEVHDAKKWSVWYWFFFRFARAVFPNNSAVGEKLKQVFHISDARVSPQPNGIDIEFFSSAPSRNEARQTLNVPQEEKIVLYSGSFLHWKGLGILLHAARLLPRVQFYLLGGTKEELREASGEKDIPDNVVVAGRQKYTAMPLWLSAADILTVIGTKSNEYSYLHTSPMKLFEYMATHIPIVLSRTQANQEIVSDREVLFYEPDNAEDFAKKIQYAIDHPAEMKKKSESAFQKSREYTWEKRAKNILNLLCV